VGWGAVAGLAFLRTPSDKPECLQWCSLKNSVWRDCSDDLLDGCVPIPAGGRIEDRSFTATVLEAEPVVQIAESFSLTWSAAVQRYPAARFIFNQEKCITDIGLLGIQARGRLILQEQRGLRAQRAGDFHILSRADNIQQTSLMSSY